MAIVSRCTETMPPTTPDLWLLFGAGLCLLTLAWLRRATPRTPRRAAAPQPENSPARGSSADSTAGGSMPSQCNMSA